LPLIGQPTLARQLRLGVFAALMLFADDAIARLHKVSLGLLRALSNAAIAALTAAATAGKALVDDECAKKAVVELTRE